MENVVLEPPLYFSENHIFDINFHPKNDFLVASEITGHIRILSYNSDDVKEVKALDHHKESCRSAFFSDDGNMLISTSKDKSFAVVDVNGQVKIHNKNAHDDAINIGYQLNDTILATGDDDGYIKIWDLRTPKKNIYDFREQDETITDIVSSENNFYMLASSQDGTLGVYDLRKSNNSDQKLYALSDCMEEDLLSVCLLKNEQFVACSTSQGAILLFKWDYFGDFKDRVLGHPNSIDTMIKYDENTLLTGAEDGFARAVSIYPNDIVNILGQHEEDEFFPIQKLSMSHCKNFLASCSHDNSIKFYDISSLKSSRNGCKTMDLNELSDVEINNESEDSMEEDDNLEESKNNKNGKQKYKKQRILTKHQLEKKKQQEDFSGEDDSEEFSDCSDDDSEEEDMEQEQQKQKKGKKRVMGNQKKILMNVRQAEVAKQKRSQFFDNL